MNVVYQGFFLREGLIRLGHNVIDLSFSDGDDINDKLECVECRIDLVVLELWTLKKIPINLHKCKYTLVAYSIDSPLNEFWFCEMSRIFDHVFVDQKSSVRSLKQKGVQARWLPLCAQTKDFRHAPPKKKYDIMFVGNTSGYRVKRNNLLGLLKKHFSVTVLQDIAASEMSDLFSQSKIVLNENFFSGLTLRIFQGLAAGSLVLTEEGGHGVDEYFKEGEHLVCYNPCNVISVFSKVLASYEEYSPVAMRGREICEKFHTSEARARALLQHIKDKSAFNRKEDGALGKYFEAKARYFLTMRYGGPLKGVITDFKSLSSAESSISSRSVLELGNISARNDAIEKAEYYYKSSLAIEKSVEANLKLGLLSVYNKEMKNAKNAIANAVLALPPKQTVKCKGAISLLEASTEPDEFLYIIAQIYFVSGSILSLGFQKQFYDKYPDTAVEVAFLAWNLKQKPEVLDFIMKCLKEESREGELLPELLVAIKRGQLSYLQLLRAAEIARQYYDFDLVNRIISSIKNKV